VRYDDIDDLIKKMKITLVIIKIIVNTIAVMLPITPAAQSTQMMMMRIKNMGMYMLIAIRMTEFLIVSIVVASMAVRALLTFSRNDSMAALEASWFITNEFRNKISIVAETHPASPQGIDTVSVESGNISLRISDDIYILVKIYINNS